MNYDVETAEQRKSAYGRAYYEANKVRKAAYQRSHLEQQRISNRASYARHREVRLKTGKARRARHGFAEQRREYHKQYSRLRKQEALLAYGGSRCLHCGTDDLDALTLDHVNGDGREHRVALTGGQIGGGPFYRKLKRLGWPNDPPLQVLCRTCNMKKSAKEGTRRAV